MTSWYLIVSARLLVQEIHADAKKRGTICTSQCHKGSECQNQARQVAKLKQGSSKRDRKPENRQVCACLHVKGFLYSSNLSLISFSCMLFVQIWIPTIVLDQFDNEWRIIM